MFSWVLVLRHEEKFGTAVGDPKAEKLRVDPAPRKALLEQLTFIFSAA